MNGSLLAECDGIVLDVDGTLTKNPFDPNVPPESIALVARLLGSGKTVALVTARGSGELDALRAALADGVRRGRYESTGQLLLFTSLGGEARKVDPLGSLPDELLYAVDASVLRPFVSAVANVARTRGWEASAWPPEPESSRERYFLHDRGMALTLFVSNWRQLSEALPALRRQFRLRFIPTAATCVHVVPADCGKQRAIAFLREALRLRKIVAVADEFHELEEIRAVGTDRDLLGADVVVQVGGAEPRDPTIIFFSNHRRAHKNTLSFFRAASEHDENGVRALSEAKYANRKVLAARVKAVFTERESHRRYASFAEDLVRYLSGVDFEGTLPLSAREAVRALRLPEPPGPLALLSTLVATSIFGRWLSTALDFERNARSLTLWLWEEREVQGHLSLAEILRNNFQANKRYVFQPEELPAYLVPLLPAVKEGYRIVCVGKDGEALLPCFEALLSRAQSAGVLESYRTPVGMKVSARKPRAAKGVVDSLQALEQGNLARELVRLLTPEEKGQRLSPAAVALASSAIQELAPEVSRELDLLVGSASALVMDGTREEIVAKLADAPIDAYTLYFDVSKLFRNMCVLEAQGRTGQDALQCIEESSPQCKEFLKSSPLAIVLRSIGKDGLGNNLLLVVGIFEEVLAGLFEKTLRTVRHPYGKLLAAVFDGTQCTELLRSKLFFVDTTLYAGTTRLYLEVLRSIFDVTEPWKFGVMAAALSSFARRVRSSIDFIGASSIVFGEGSPEWFDFYYDDDGAKVPYARLLAERPASSTVADAVSTMERDAHAFFLRYAPQLAGIRTILDTNGVPWVHYFRWWLYREPVWEMRLFSDKWPFRNYFRMPPTQKECAAFAEKLDELVGAAERDELRAATRDLREHETIELLGEWSRRRARMIERIELGLDHLFEHAGPLLHAYVAEPSPERIKAIQNVTLSNVDILHREWSDGS